MLAAANNGGAGGRSEADARPVDGGSGGGGALAEAAAEDGGNGDAFAVILFKILGLDAAGGVQQKQAGMGDALGETVLDVLIANAKGVDDFGLGIGEQRVRDLLALGEVGEGGRGVVAERGDAVAEFANGFGLYAQLNELGFAVWSPVGGAEEENPEPFGAAEGGKVAAFARGVEGCKGWCRGADGGAVTLGERLGGGRQSGELDVLDESRRGAFPGGGAGGGDAGLFFDVVPERFAVPLELNARAVGDQPDGGRRPARGKGRERGGEQAGSAAGIIETAAGGARELNAIAGAGLGAKAQRQGGAAGGR